MYTLAKHTKPDDAGVAVEVGLVANMNEVGIENGVGTIQIRPFS